MTAIFHRWLAAFAACVALCLVSIRFVDRRLVDLLYPVFHPYLFLNQVLEIVVVPVPFCTAAVVLAGAARLRGRSAPPPAQSMAVAGFSVTWAIALNDLMLKPLFGRSGIYEYRQGHYGFAWFGGNVDSSFPSGHAAMLTSLLSAFWLLYPRGRIFYGGIGAVLLPMLMVAQWHFLSDVIAGVFVGATAGLMTVTLWRSERQ